MQQKKFWTKLLLILSVVGPGIIAGTADNDAGGVATYSLAGAQFGYGLLWLLLVVTFILALTQEMGGRLGIVSGKGLAALIRENFDFRATFFLVILAFVANWANILAEFAGISSIAKIYHFQPVFLVIPSAALISWIVISGNFRSVQRVFLTSSILYISYVLAGFLAHPDWSAAIKATVVPSWQPSKDFLFIAVALVGTTVTVWGQFFIQSYFAEKNIKPHELKIAKGDIYAGAIWTDLIAFFIIVATTATLFARHISIKDAADAAIALKPLAGAFAEHLFAWGLYNASMLGAGVVTISTAYMITEAFGWEGRVNLGFRRAPTFYKTFLFCIVSTAVFILIPGLPVFRILIVSQALNTFLLPVLFYYLIRLLNREDIMGKYKNSLFWNIAGWACLFLITGLNFLYFYYLIFK